MTSTLEPLLSTEEVAERLGVEQMTVYREMNRGRLAYVMVGRLKKVRPVDLAAYIECQRVPASEVPASEAETAA